MYILLAIFSPVRGSCILQSYETLINTIFYTHVYLTILDISSLYSGCMILFMQVILIVFISLRTDASQPADITDEYVL